MAGLVDWTIAASSTNNEIHLERVTGVSGGNLIAAGSINKYDTNFPNPSAQVRTSNSNATVAGDYIGFGTVFSATTHVSRKKHEPPATFVLRPGEGIAIDQDSAGDNDQRYDMDIHWAEK